MRPLDLKKRLVISFVILAFSMSLFVVATWAWFTQLIEDDQTYTVGYVSVDVDPYFEVWNAGTETYDRIEATFVTLPENPAIAKTGVYLIVLDTRSSYYFFENFRLRFVVNSSVDTYFRVKIYEQLTLTYENYQGGYTELTILNNSYMPFDYDLTNWIDQRQYDDYMYYSVPVKRVDLNTPTYIDLIDDYTLDDFPIYDLNYSLQITFQLEAVQAYGGPQNEWGLSTKPWDNSDW